MKTTLYRLLRALPVLALLLGASFAMADSAVLTRSGTLYEVLRVNYGDLYPHADAASTKLPVLALRTTKRGGQPVTELIDGTVTPDAKVGPSIEYEPTTDTVFVVYTRYSGIMADVHFAVRRGGEWIEKSIIPSMGLYFSLNPQLVVTRQSYVDLDDNLEPVRKTRSIVSIVWWEESGRSQARYAPVFVEDGVLHLDAITPYNLNELAGAAGPTNLNGLPFSSYQFPSVQRDPTSNGGVIVSFANMATQKHSVLRISFPDDIQAIIATGVPIGPEAYVRIHSPIGRGGRDGRIPKQIDIPGSVSTVVSPTSLEATFYWADPGAVYFLSDDATDDTEPTSLPLRTDFSIDRAITVVREMSLKD